MELEPKDKVTVYLAEYQNLRAEQMKRIDSQNQAVNYLLLVLGFTATAAGSGLTKPEILPQIIFWILLFLPVIAAPLAFVFFDHELAIHSVGSYIYHVWYKNTVEHLIDNKLAFSDSLKFPFLKPDGGVHGKLSEARWILFLVPTLAPTILIPLYGLLHIDYWWAIFEQQGILRTIFSVSFCLIVWFGNIYSCRLIWKARKWAKSKHNIGREVVVIYNSGTNISDAERLNEGLKSTPSPSTKEVNLASFVQTVMYLPNGKLKANPIYGIGLMPGISDDHRNEIVSYFKESEFVHAVRQSEDPSTYKKLPVKD